MSTRRNSRKTARQNSTAQSRTRGNLHRRQLRYEPLEDRRLLAVVTVNTLADTINFNDGLTSLREAIFATNLVGGPDTIDFAPALTAGGPATILLTQGELKITDNLTIMGPGASLLTIDASGNDPMPDVNNGDGTRVFNIDNGNSTIQIDVEIRALTLTGGDVRGDGGAIRALERISLRNIHFVSNSATTGGGVFYRGDLAILIEGASFRGNSARDGGGVFVASIGRAGGKATILSSSFSENRASNSGGAVFLEGSTSFNGSATGGQAEITKSEFISNLASRHGGAVFLEGGVSFAGSATGGKVTITDSVVTSNVASRQGGAVWLGGGSATASQFSGGSSATIISSQFLSNSAEEEGGAIFAPAGTPIGVSSNFGGSQVSITNSKILGNSAGDDGGALFAGFSYEDRGTVSLIDSEISGNTSAGDGGGAFVPGSVNIEKCTFRANVASNGGALALGGTLFVNSISNVTESVFSDNSASRLGGAAFAHYRRLTISRSAISGNTAASGGGIFGDWIYLTIENSSVTDNLGRSGGGGIGAVNGTRTIAGSLIAGNSTYGSGGGISAFNGATTITNSTVSDNSAAVDGGGMRQTEGNVSVAHSTIAKNSAINEGGGIFASPLLNVSLDHTIVAGNHTTVGTSPDIAAVSDHLIARYSLVGINAGNDLTEAPVGSPDPNGNLIGGPVHGVIDPLLGALADNGGPTRTHALLAGSPAINAGNLNAVAGANGVPLYDQRGEPFGRVFNGRIDIGAFEYQEPSDLNLLVDTLVDESDGNYGRGDSSLREAIELANIYPSIDTIHFDPALTAGGPAKILLTQGELKISDDLAINGPGASLLTIDASGNDPTPGVFDGKGSRTFNISDGTSNRIEVSISGLCLTGGDTTGGGGVALSSAENLNLADMVAEENAGGLSVVSCSGKLIMDRSHIVHNTLLFVQGGVSALNTSEATIRDSEISFNTGGGITAGVPTGTTFLIADSTISDNAGTGVTIKSATGNVEVLRSTISGNVGTVGGLSVDGKGTVLIRDSVFARNTGLAGTGGTGGGASIGAITITVQNTSFIDNRGTTGAGLRAVGNLTIADSEFRGNMITAASGDGGGLWFSGAGATSSVIAGNTFAENVATRGGGIFVNLPSNHTATLSDNTFIANTADTQGAGIAILATGGAATISRTTIHGNHSAVMGGGMWLSATNAARIRVEDSTIDGNSARGEGGGGATIAASGPSDVTFLQTTISSNSATGSGGGLSVNAASTANVSVVHSTITKNGFGLGGGISNNGNGIPQISHSIIAGNFGLTTSPDLRGNVNLSFSLIGNSAGSGLTPAPVGSPDAHGNLVGGVTTGSSINAKLGPLGDNGGPTMTHALLPGSPAINAGDPAAVAGVNGVPMNDQRGAPFTRVYGGRIDIGAFEFQPTDHLLGDFNRDGVVDAGDYTIGRKQGGLSVPPGTGADANGDGLVNDADLAIWRFSYGLTQAPTVSTLAQKSKAALLRTPLSFAAERPAVVRVNRSVTRSNHSSRAVVNEAPQLDMALEAWLASRVGIELRDMLSASSAKSSDADDAADAAGRRESFDAIMDEAFSALI